MLQKYFLGANSKDGFYSLYDYFPPDKDAFLHIIKAGPGGGKSGFMRAIAAEAGKQGMDVQLILCSGDPDSLDGLYIPSLKTAWVDGTNPHSREPRAFGADADYICLSQFMRGGFSEEDKAYVNLYSASYKAAYSDAYSLLSSAFRLKRAVIPHCPSEEEKTYISRRIDGIIRRNPRTAAEFKGNLNPRFLSALSSAGYIRFGEQISLLCKLSYRLCSMLGYDVFALAYAAAEAEKREEPIIKIPSPLSPDMLTALIFPERGIALTDKSWEIPQSRNINLDRNLKADRNERMLIKKGRDIELRIMDMAYGKLSQAKCLHDKLEAVYRPYMDFTALNAFTRDQIKNIFK